MIAKERNFDSAAGTPYVFQQEVGGGVFGVVCKAIDTTDIANPLTIAVKKIPLERHATNVGLLKRVYREVFILRNVNSSDHVIKILDAFIQPSSKNGGLLSKDLYIVMQYMEADLYQVLHGRFRFNTLSLEHIRCLTYQFLLGLDYLHSAKPPIIHRDLKPHNLLLNESCRLMIADFGLARVYSTATTKASGDNSQQQQQQQMTQYVVARAYRAPELVFGLPYYSTPIDMWSVGCIVSEMITRRFLLPAQNPLELIAMMLSSFGPPPSSVVNRISAPNVRSYVLGFQQRFSGNARTFFQNLVLQNLSNISSPVPPRESEVVALVDFLTQLLLYDPDKRLSARNAEKHAFIKADSRPPLKPPKLSLNPHFEENIASLSIEQLAQYIHQEVEILHRTRCPSLQNAAGSSQQLFASSLPQQQLPIDESSLYNVAAQLSMMDESPMVANELADIEKNIS